jgi:flagellar biosynthesis/type III secretory pathway M-ring protein FliF/YscJ
MNQSVLIVVISIIVAVVVGSGVFFLWTLIERLRSRPATEETAEATDNEEQEQAESTGEAGDEG